MNSLLSLRAVLVTGKGGVGKTTVSAAIARYAAGQGKRVLCAEVSGEVGAASSLAEALGVPRLEAHPTHVATNLRAVLLEPSLGHASFLADVLPMRWLADAAMRSAAVRRFFAAAPTFAEMGALYRLLDFVRAKRSDGSHEHEMIVVDLPATGHALALAQIPSALLQIIPTGPIASAVREGLNLLYDAQKTGAVVVTLPETLPVSEALELMAGIREHRIPLAGICLNRVPFDPFDDSEREAARALLASRGPLLGQRTLERIDRARGSAERLTREGAAALTVFHDVIDEGPALIEAIAGQISKGVAA